MTTDVLVPENPVTAITDKLQEMASNPNRAKALEELEQQASSMLLVSERMGWSAYIALHIIREENLWQEVRDENGAAVYNRFEDWLEEFRFKVKTSRAVAFRRLQTLRIATGGLGMSLDEVASYNPSTLHAICQALPYDTKSGEIDDAVPEGKIGKEKAIELLEETAVLPPGEVMASLREAQGKAIGKYYVEIDCDSGLIEKVSFIDTDGLQFGLSTMPKHAVQDFAKKLRAEVIEV